MIFLLFLITLSCAFPRASLAQAISASEVTITSKVPTLSLIDEPVSATTAMGRVFVSEGDWNSLADEALIMTVYKNRLAVLTSPSIRSMTYTQRLIWIAKRYSNTTFRPSEVRSVRASNFRTPRQMWVDELNNKCTEPEHWPKLASHPPWKDYIKLCQGVFKRAYALIHNIKTSLVCSSDMPVDHWGGAMDEARAKKWGWVKAKFSCWMDGKEYLPKNQAWCSPDLSKCKTPKEKLVASSRSLN